MMPRHAVGLLSSLLLCAAAPSARAAVTLRSAMFTQQSASQPRGGELTVFQGPNYNFSDISFASAVVGPEGLTVVPSIRGLGGTYSNAPGPSLIKWWRDEGFVVVFDLDQPALFTYHRGEDRRPPGSVLLRADDQPLPVFRDLLIGDVSGVLPPGHYTFTGDTGARFLPIPVGFAGGTSITDVRLSVLVPEPALLAPLAGLLLSLRRRR
jgi:hypothetical protein